jgi:hypothetical protein
MFPSIYRARAQQLIDRIVAKCFNTVLIAEEAAILFVMDQALRIENAR